MAHSVDPDETADAKPDLSLRCALEPIGRFLSLQYMYEQRSPDVLWQSQGWFQDAFLREFDLIKFPYFRKDRPEQTV